MHLSSSTSPHGSAASYAAPDSAPPTVPSELAHLITADDLSDPHRLNRLGMPPLTAVLEDGPTSRGTEALDLENALKCVSLLASAVNDVAAGGRNVAARLFKGMTPLHAVCSSERWSRESRTRLVEALLDHGARPNVIAGLATREAASDPQFLSTTPLHMAAANGDRDVCARLIRAGALVNIMQGSEDSTALDLASGHPEVAQLLEQQGGVGREFLEDKGTRLGWATNDYVHAVLQAGPDQAVQFPQLRFVSDVGHMGPPATDEALFEYLMPHGPAPMCSPLPTLRDLTLTSVRQSPSLLALAQHRLPPSLQRSL